MLTEFRDSADIRVTLGAIAAFFAAAVAAAVAVAPAAGLAFDDALITHVERLEDRKPVILCGDFNAILDTGDVYAENAHYGEDVEGLASDNVAFEFETFCHDLIQRYNL